MAKTPIPSENKKVMRQHTEATKNFGDKTIVDGLLTVSWNNYCYATGVVKPVYQIPTFPLIPKAV